MAKEPTTTREALAAQIMEDIDALVRRFEDVNVELGAKMKESIQDGAAKALLETRLNFESMMESQQVALQQAGREAAARIGNELNRSAAPLMLAAGGLRRWFLVFALAVLAAAIVAGALGAFIGYRLAAM